MYDSKYWNKVNNLSKKHYYNGLMYSYKLYSYIELIKELNIRLKNKSILITDLFDESYMKENLFKYLNRYNNKVTGIDISKVTIKRVKKKNNFKNIMVADARHLRFKKNTFDIIISPSTCDHMPKKFLREHLDSMYYTLKDDGVILLTLHNKFNLYFDWYLTDFSNQFKFIFEKYSLSDFRKILSKTNLITKRKTSIIHIPFPFFLSIILNKIQSNNNYSKKLLNLLLKLERLKNLKLFQYTGQLLAFELIKKV